MIGNRCSWHQGKQVKLRATVLRVIENLVRRAGTDVISEFLQVVHVKVGHAPRPDFTRRAQPFKGRHSFGQRNAAAPVQEVEVDHVRTQPAQAALTGGRQPLSAGVVRVDFAHHEHTLTLTHDGLADDFLGTAISVHLRRVDECHPQIDAQSQRGNFFLGRVSAFAHLPGALSEHGHRRSVWQRDRFHKHVAESFRRQDCVGSMVFRSDVDAYAYL